MPQIMSNLSKEKSTIIKVTFLKLAPVGIYLAIIIFSSVPYESATNSLRRIFLFLIDGCIMTIACVILLDSVKKYHDAIASLVCGAIIVASLAIFEYHKEWLLYHAVIENWGLGSVTPYLFRGEDLRARSSTGHALSLGLFLSIAIILSLYLRNSLNKLWHFVIVILGLGLYSTLSRGPIVVTIVAAYFFLILMAGEIRKFVLGSSLIIVGLVVVGEAIGVKYISDIFENFWNVDSQNIDYRIRLFEISVQVISSNPWFGSPIFIQGLEDLKQGEGIIDLVNVYVGILLYSGIVGATCFFLPIIFAIISLLGVYREASSRIERFLPEVSGAILICILSLLIQFSGTSFGVGGSFFYWTLIGLAYSSSGSISRGDLNRLGGKNPI